MTFLYALTSSLTLATIFRDRMAARVWRDWVSGILSSRSKLGDRHTSYVFTNIMRANTNKDLQREFKAIMVVSCLLTLTALVANFSEMRTHETSRRLDATPTLLPRYGLMLLFSYVMCIIFGYGLMDYLYVSTPKSDKVYKNDNEEFGPLWSYHKPLLVILLASCGIFIFAVVMMDMGGTVWDNINERGSLILGLLVYMDSAMHFAKSRLRNNNANKQKKDWKDTFGEDKKHMDMGMP